MIVQCSQCQTRFRLDDARMTAAGVKVRCSRCRHVFTVHRDDAPERSAFAAVLRDQVAEDAGNHPNDLPDDAVKDEQPLPEHGEEDWFASDAGIQDEEPEPAPAEEPFQLYDPAEVEGALQVEPGDATQETDHAEEPQAADGAGEQRVEEDWFQPSSVSEPDLGTDAAVGYCAQPAIAEPAFQTAEQLPSAAPTPVPESDELPPLSISSRRRCGPAASLVRVAGVGLLLAALAAGGYHLATRNADDAGSGVGSLARLLTPTAGGRGVLENVAGTYLVNREAGEILVVRGELLNKSSNPLPMPQVRGQLFAADGRSVASLTVPSAVQITDGQLASFAVTDIQKALAGGAVSASRELAPGERVPVVLVFLSVPAAAREFGLEVIDGHK